MEEFRAGGAGMVFKIKIGAIGYTLQLFEIPAEGKTVLDIGGGFGIMRQFIIGILARANIGLRYPQIKKPSESFLDPILIPLIVILGQDKIFQLHLLELTRAEKKISRRDFVPEIVDTAVNARTPRKNLIRPIAQFAFLAIHHGIGKMGDMTRGLPNFGVH